MQWGVYIYNIAPLALWEGGVSVGKEFPCRFVTSRTVSFRRVEFRTVPSRAVPYRAV